MTARKKPCDECPFKKSSLPGWLADYTPTQLHGYVMSERPFPCHMTHEENLTFQEAEDYPLCGGALAYMKKNAKMPRDRDMADYVKQIDKEQLEEILSTPEFFKHHTI